MSYNYNINKLLFLFFIYNFVWQPIRTVAVFEEYLYPPFRDVFFYRHVSTGACYLDKPDKLRLLDEQVFHEKRQIQQFG